MSDNRTPTITDSAAYIADACAELYRLTLPHRLSDLGYLIDMARLEAERVVKQLREEDRRSPNR